MTRRVYSVVTLLVLVASPVFAQTPPSLDQLPKPSRVTDPARPDAGYIAWAGTELTVLVVFGASCDACRDSVPFYKRLASLPAIDGKARRFALLTKGGVVPVLDQIEKHPAGFSPGRASSYPEDDRFKVSAMPAVIVFDGTWNERGRWEGRLSEAEEAAVIDLIGRIAKGAKR